MILAIVAVVTEFGRRSALAATYIAALDGHFFIFTRRVKEMVRFANFSKPCTRRIAFRSARGFAIFILRFRTHLVGSRLSFRKWYPAGMCAPIAACEGRAPARDNVVPPGIVTAPPIIPAVGMPMLKAGVVGLAAAPPAAPAMNAPTGPPTIPPTTVRNGFLTTFQILDSQPGSPA
ncbi:MAG: hypothetical protein V3S36_09705 [Acidiferrobacterales bacterium]